MKRCNARRRWLRTLYSQRVCMCVCVKSPPNGLKMNKNAHQTCKFITLCDETKIDLKTTFGSQKWMQPNAYQLSMENMQNACDFIYIDLSSNQRMAATTYFILLGEWKMQMNEIKCDYGWPMGWGESIHELWTQARYDENFMQMWQFETCEVRRSWKQKQTKKKCFIHSYSLPWCSALVYVCAVVLSNPMCAITADAHMHFPVSDVSHGIESITVFPYILKWEEKKRKFIRI